MDTFSALKGRQVTIAGQFVGPVIIEDLEPLDDSQSSFAVHVRTPKGDLKETILTSEEIQNILSTHDVSPTWKDSHRMFMLVESARIKLAYAWDPHFAVSMSGIEALPHQLEAVYERMLPQARLRFLLADDPGAGKTIMAGLLLKELRLRGAVERALILSPAPLTLQWQDELRSKFDETFELIDSHRVRDQLGGSPWRRFPHCVASIDFAKQPHILAELAREHWDLVIIDEAHKIAMPDEDKPTQRYKLAQQIAQRTERLLLLTATPHQGNPQQFQNLLRILDEDVFSDRSNSQKILQENQNIWMLRRMKEDLRDFDGKKLFVNRHAYTCDFQLQNHEYNLYEAVTSYINTYLSEQQGRRKQSTALARVVFQRRLASSLRAIRVSIEQRHKRIRELHQQLQALPPEERQRLLQEKYKESTKIEYDYELNDDDFSEEAMNQALENTITSQHFEKIQEELQALSQLETLAIETEKINQESKLHKLFQLLDENQFQSLKDHQAKLVIFTEQRPTLEHLRTRLEARGYACCEIHGGLDALERKDVQQEFKLHKQILLATDAAGEGINLQFCHLMINYDVPWNPMRLEQRMGRIHRFGQTRDVHVFNFVATSGPLGPSEQPVIEGRVLQRLLHKLDEIRTSIGDRVFDVIGMLLRTNKVDLEDIVRLATTHPKKLEDYMDEIEKISQDRLLQYEQSTGIALARRSVDLSRIRNIDLDSEEKRLMPEYVEDFFFQAAKNLNLHTQRKANPALFSIQHVPSRFRAHTLLSVRLHGEPSTSYNKLSFHKRELAKPDHLDGSLLSPSHPLYLALDELLLQDLQQLVGTSSLFLDPCSAEPYRLYFFQVELEGETLDDPAVPPQTRSIHAELVAVRESLDGSLSFAPCPILHDLTPLQPPYDALDLDHFQSPPSPKEHQKVERWLRVHHQLPLMNQRKEQRQQEIQIRKDFLQEAFSLSIRKQEEQWSDLAAKVASGNQDFRFARDQSELRLKDIKQTLSQRLGALQHMSIVRPGRLSNLCSITVAPSPEPYLTQADVEHIAIQTSIQHELQRGWSVTDVSRRLDHCGFDLRSISPPDEDGQRQVRRIEVKGRASTSLDVHLTPNEWKQAQRLGDTYWLYIVSQCDSPNPILTTLQNPWKKLQPHAQEITSVKGYRLPHSAIHPLTQNKN